MNGFDSQVKAVQWHEDKLRLLDQRLLPETVSHLDFDSAQEVADAIREMVVRGAPAIGITAAYAVVLAARNAYERNPADWKADVRRDCQMLSAARPTAVNLIWAIREMEAIFDSCSGDPVATLLDKAIQIQTDDIKANQTLGQLGAEVIGAVDGILTHCNAGALATGGYGTALGVIRSCWSNGNLKQVYANETRPWLQGSRLTAWELIQDEVPVTLIVDSAASHLMKSEKIQWVVVGADRIAANGDVANKIGTYQLAIAARHHGVRFMVAAPCSTIDLNIRSGDQIPIEERAQEEVLGFRNTLVAPNQTVAWNPAFDITPANLIDAIVTESGVVQEPNEEKIRGLF